MTTKIKICKNFVLHIVGVTLISSVTIIIIS